MTNTHIEEYRAQIEKHQRDIIALRGAIQALERLQQEQPDIDKIVQAEICRGDD